MVRPTGERPDDRHSPDALLALHRAGYRDIEGKVGSGVVVDIGCGVGFGATTFLRDDRTVIGIDYDTEAAAAAQQRWNADGLVVITADGAILPLADNSVDFIISSHVIEHFVDPRLHVAEMARALRPGGTAFVLTPNAPADFENPFHVHPFTAETLQAMLSEHFGELWLGGHDGTAAVKQNFGERRDQAAKLLALDVFDLRHRVPHSWYVGAYSLATRLFYRLQSGDHAAGASGITPDDFSTTETIDDSTLSLFAIASTSD